ncbi:MAG: hypothetical protein IJT06_05365 [Selenomonadaceae bacterium]|nr:hypothetical protein [Selenomonadaceae bacterium]
MIKVNSKIAATNRYNDKTYDRLAIRIKKGLREKYKQAAKTHGLSLAKLVTTAIDEFLENHKDKISK